MKLKSLAFAVACAGSASCLAESSYYLAEDTDLATYNLPSGYDRILPYGTSPTKPVSFWLSSDAEAAFSYLQCVTGGGALLFDFARDGDHTLTLSAGSMITASSGLKVDFRGGVWNLNGQGPYWANYGTTRYSDQRVTFDATVQTNFPCAFILGAVNNGSVVLMNGAYMSDCKNFTSGAYGYYVYQPVAYSYPDGQGWWGTNCTFTVSGGSVFRSEYSVTFAHSGASLDALSDFRALFTGAGTQMWSANAGSLVSIGHSVGGTEVKFDDHAYGRAYYTRVGCGANADYSRFVLDGGATYTNVGDSVAIGYASGADHCQAEILNGAELSVGGLAAVYDLQVGRDSSFNELFVSNATVRAAKIVAGATVASSNNVVRIMGRDSVWKAGVTGDYSLFVGPGNAFVYDDAAIDRTGCNYCLYNSTNNAFRLENGASAKMSNLFVGHPGGQYVLNCDAVGNTVFVGAGSTLEATTQIMLTGRDNAIVISNGTLKANNQYAVYIGHKESSYTKFAVEGNKLVFQGGSPKLRSDSASASMNFENGTQLVFDLPLDGVYAETPIVAGSMNLASATYSFPNINKLQENLEHNVDIVLARTADWAMNVPSDDLTDRVSPPLPKGCTLKRRGNWNRLELHVKRGSKGMSIIIK